MQTSRARGPLATTMAAANDQMMAVAANDQMMAAARPDEVAAATTDAALAARSDEAVAGPAAVLLLAPLQGLAVLLWAAHVVVVAAVPRVVRSRGAHQTS